MSIMLGVFLLVCAGLFAREAALAPDGRLHIRFLSVGQGDSAMVTTPSGNIVVIDGGPDWSTLEGLGRYLPFFDRHIDMLVLSHPNLDHLASFPEVLKRYSVGSIVFSGIENPLPRYNEMLELAAHAKTQLVPVAAGQTIDAGDGVTLRIVWPPQVMPKGFTKNVNDTSVVLMLEYQGHRALFTGDGEKATEETLARATVDLRADILKVGHHGSKTSSSTGFLLAVHPSLAVISVGKNSFGHPRPEIMSRLQSIGAEVRRTDQEGTIHIVW